MNNRTLFTAACCGLGLSLSADAAGVKSFDIHLYDEIGVIGDTDTQKQPVAKIGMLDIFAKAQLNSELSLLSETMLGMSSGGMAMVHQPRLFLDYRPKDVFKLRVGRFHSPIGYYVTNYAHTNNVFRLTTRRPRLLAMGMGGEEMMMPMHTTGAKVFGTAHLGSVMDLNYDLAFGNGGLDDAALDEHTSYTAATRVGMRPNAVDGLEIGTSLRLGKIHSDQLDLSTDSGVDMSGMSHRSMGKTTGSTSADAAASERPYLNETIIVGYVAYTTYPVELIAEVFSVDHTMDSFMGGESKLLGYWGQFGWSFDRYTPYVRYEAFSRDLGDLLYAYANAPEEWQMVRAGLNIGIHENVALKIEGGRNMDTAIIDYALQIAVGF